MEELRKCHVSIPVENGIESSDICQLKVNGAMGDTTSNGDLENKSAKESSKPVLEIVKSLDEMKAGMSYYPVTTRHVQFEIK